MAVLQREIQIVAFNNPYPPDYGGAIDIYYKVKALSALGVKVHLHILIHNRYDISGLNPFCASITVYPQKRNLLRHISFLPFSVNSRRSKELYKNLTRIKAPVIFESLRTCYLLGSKTWVQKTAVRCHNIEHDYSFGLSKSEPNIFLKIAQIIEGCKLKRFEKVLNKADVIFSISQYEQSYFSARFRPKTAFIPVFQGYETINSKDGYGKFALYHGDLTTADNVKSAHFLIDVFKTIDFPLVIAGTVINTSLKRRIAKYNNITFQKILSHQQLLELIEKAHVNTLYSFQRSGTKLKVFTALFNGRHCIINKHMVDDERILNVCRLAESLDDYKKQVVSIFNEEFKLTEDRAKALSAYNDMANAKRMLEHLF